MLPLPLSHEVIARAAQSAAGITNDFAMIVFILASPLIKFMTQAHGKITIENFTNHFIRFFFYSDNFIANFPFISHISRKRQLSERAHTKGILVNKEMRRIKSPGSAPGLIYT